MRRAFLLSLAGGLLAVAGCSEVVDETVVIEIGALRPSMAHTGLGTQVVSLDPADYRIQFIEWRVVPKPPGPDATDGLHLDLSGVGINLTCVDPTGQCALLPCAFFDSAVTSPRASGRCADGVVVDSIPEDQPGDTAVLDVKLEEVLLYRLRPIAYELGSTDTADWDGDSEPDVTDNCPLVDNPDQRDTGSKGFGDRCAAFDSFSRLILLDSDADDVPDLRDNCPDVRNPDQADAGKRIGIFVAPDGIGDACDHREELAVVQADAEREFTKRLPSLNPIFRGNAWLTLDYTDAFDLDDCTWVLSPGSGDCELRRNQVTMCRDLRGGEGCF